MFYSFCSAINVELVEAALDSFKKGKACGLDGITVEHLGLSHPSCLVCLSKLFNLILFCGHVPDTFRSSYVVPIVKSAESGGSLLVCDSFRGITISSVIAKLFEKCLLALFDDFLYTSDC